MTTNKPLERLRHHVSGAIARGEAQAIVAVPAKTKEMLFKTARAMVSCSQFKAGEYVSVSFYHWGDNGQAWYLINHSEKGQLEQTVAYPASHLSEFVL